MLHLRGAIGNARGQAAGPPLAAVPHHAKRLFLKGPSVGNFLKGHYMRFYTPSLLSSLLSLCGV